MYPDEEWIDTDNNVNEPDLLEEFRNKLTSHIPTAAGLLGEVIRVVFDSESDAGDLVEIIEHDPPISAKIIQVANSSYYSQSSPVTSLRRAIVTLGFGSVAELVMSMSMVQFLFAARSVREIDYPGLWLHSVAVGRGAQQIMASLDDERTDEAYTYGLLHDIGKIALALVFPELYEDSVSYAGEQSTSIYIAERTVIGIDHCQAGRIVSEKLGLPDDIVSIVGDHHSIVPGKGERLYSVVYLADLVARRASIGYPGDDLMPDPQDETLEYLELDRTGPQKSFEALVSLIGSQKSDLMQFYSSLDNI